jgi:hypothetical protein
MPDKSGVVSAANAGQTNIAAKVNAETARWKSFLVIDRMAFLLAYSAYLILSRRGVVATVTDEKAAAGSNMPHGLCIIMRSA